MRSAQDLLAELNAADESPRIEAKRSREIGKSVLETVIAFANEPGLGGGHILLGVSSEVDEKGDTHYWAEGITDPDKIQRDLATQCASTLNAPIRPEMRVEPIDGKTVIVVYVAEVDVAQKPVYLKATGLPKGAFRRIGSTDQRCTDEDLWVLRGASQPQVGPDMAVIPDARMEDFDPQAIAEYRRLRAMANPGPRNSATTTRTCWKRCRRHVESMEHSSRRWPGSSFSGNPWHCGDCSRHCASITSGSPARNGSTTRSGVFRRWISASR